MADTLVDPRTLEGTGTSQRTPAPVKPVTTQDEISWITIVENGRVVAEGHVRSGATRFLVRNGVVYSEPYPDLDTLAKSTVLNEARWHRSQERARREAERGWEEHGG